MFHKNRIFKLSQIISQTELLTLLADSLKVDGLVKDSFLEGVLARELEYPTGIFMETHSVAIPHTEFEHVNRTGFAIAINDANVEFRRTDDPSEIIAPKIVVMMAIDQTCEKVSIIQSLFALLSDKEHVNEIVKMTPDNIEKVFTNAVITG